MHKQTKEASAISKKASLLFNRLNNKRYTAQPILTKVANTPLSNRKEIVDRKAAENDEAAGEQYPNLATS